MSRLRNKVQLIGRLGKDPEILTLDSGKKLAKFSLATSDKYKNAKGEVIEDAQWHNCIAWEKLADIIERYVKKGDEIAVEGKIVTRTYDKEGEKRYATEIVVNELLMLGGKKEESAQSSTVPSQEQALIGGGMEPDDLPF